MRRNADHFFSDFMNRPLEPHEMHVLRSLLYEQGGLNVNRFSDSTVRRLIQGTLKPEHPTGHYPARLSKQTCACNREVTLDELCKVYRNQKREICAKFLNALNSTFKAYEVTSCLRKAHFLAQVGHESGELKFLAEKLRKGQVESDVYDGYKGRGLLQLTWKRNYRDYGRFVKHDFTGAHRADLEKPEWATNSAGWYWTTKRHLNTLADSNDFLAITCNINGAFNGFDDRLRILRLGVVALGANRCKVAKLGGRAYLPFEQSDIYKNWLYAFAWGAWNDPKTNKSGLAAKDTVDRRAGYNRYAQLKNEMMKIMSDSQKQALQAQHHFHYTGKQMDDLASAGSK